MASKTNCELNNPPKVTLPASEVSDTFPVNVPQNGQKVKVRVLSKEKGTVVTMREGSLERPEKENVEVRMGLAATDLVRFSVLLPSQIFQFLNLALVR